MSVVIQKVLAWRFGLANGWLIRRLWFASGLMPGLTLAASLSAAGLPSPAPAWALLANAQVDGKGIYLSQVVMSNSIVEIPALRLGDAPGAGLVTIITRAELIKVMQKNAPGMIFTNWTGAERVRITRFSRVLKESEMKQRLLALLQEEHVKDKGELELQFQRPWLPLTIPDEFYTIKILDLPSTGVSANFIAHFDLSIDKESLGSWQIPITAKVWREILVARAPVKRGTPFSQAELASERRDVLALRDAPLALSQPGTALEFADNVMAGTPVYERSVRPRPVVRRGQMVEAQLQDGPMQISMKVEVMENGSPGQLVRVRNPESRREFRGKVQNEQTILILL